MARTITVEITFDDPEDPEAFSAMNSGTIWQALCRAFPYSCGAHWTVCEIAPAKRIPEEEDHHAQER
jgi:hypothetical protein